MDGASQDSVATTQDSVATIIGAAAQAWPVPDCACVLCLAAVDAPEGGVARSGRQLTALRVTAELTLQGTTPVGGAPLLAGDTRQVGTVRLLALPAGEHDPAEVALIVGVGGQALLWAPTAGPLGAVALDALSGAGLVGAALDVRGKDGRPDPLVLARDVARLRQCGALADGADLVAVGLSHEVGELARLSRRLGRWGVRLAEPGGRLGAGSATDAAGRELHDRARGVRRTLVLGAAASGKSAAAEDLLAAEPTVHYAATGPAPTPQDDDWAARVARHRARRPAWWQTIEDADLPGLLSRPGPPLLVDSLGTWVAAALGRCGAWDDDPAWTSSYEREVAAMVRAWRGSRRRVVAVGEETGWGVVPPTSSGRRFRDALGALTRRLADESEQVLLVVAGRAVDLTALDRAALDRTALDALPSPGGAA